MEYSQPPVYIYGIQINEPVTSVTALLISVICFYAFFRLRKLSAGNKTLVYLRLYFLVMALATANGGIIGHAFLFHFSYAWKLIGWVLSMFSIMLIERASIEHVSKLISLRLLYLFKWINVIELVVFVIITMVTLNFFFVEVHTTYGLLIVVASLHFYVYRKTKSEGSRLFLIAVGFAAVSALLYMNEVSLCRWFNYNDISHVGLSIAAWYFYLGSRKIGAESFTDMEGRTRQNMPHVK